MRQTITQNITLEKHDRAKLESGRSIEIVLKNGDMITFAYDRGNGHANGHVNENGYAGRLGKNMSRVLAALKTRPMRRAEIASTQKMQLWKVSDGLYNLHKKGVIKKGEYGWVVVNGK